MSKISSGDWESVSKWMHPKTEVADQLTVKRVVEIMVQRNIGSVIVVSSSSGLGMLTERDILSKVIVKGLDPSKTIVRDVMTKPLVTIGKDATIWDAAELMGRHHIRRLPVTDKDGEIVGVITTRNVSDAIPVISRFGESEDIISSLRRLKHNE